MIWHDVGKETPDTDRQVLIIVKSRIIGNRVALGAYQGGQWNTTIAGTPIRWGEVPPHDVDNWHDARHSKPEPCQRVLLLVTNGRKKVYAMGGIDINKNYYNNVNDTWTVLKWRPVPVV